MTFALPIPQANADAALRKRAKRRVAIKLGFLVHLTVFVLVNTGLWLIAEAAGRGHGHLWAMSGWGLGLAIHGVVTLLGLGTEGLRERMVADELQRLAQRR